MKLPGNKKEIQLKYNLTAREYNIIERCISFVGEPYNFLGLVPIYSTGMEIKKAFIKTRKSFDQHDQPDQIYYCDLCFELLSNKKIRNVYNLEFLEQRLQIYNQSGDSDIYLAVSFLLKFISVPFDTLRVYGLGKSYLVSPLKATKQLISDKGYSIFYKGIATTLCYGSISIFAVQLPLEKLINYLTTPSTPISKNKKPSNINDDEIILQQQQNNSIIKIILNVFINIAVSYPITIVGGCCVLSSSIGKESSFFNTFKNVFFQKQLSDIPSPLTMNQIFKLGNFKHLFYSFAPTVCLMACRKLILNTMKGLEVTLLKKKYENPNSMFWSYSKSIYCNIFVRSFITSILLSPSETIRLQYPLQLINSIINNQQIPIVINPIAMAIQLVRENGISKLFNGVFSLYPSIILNSLASKYERNIELNDEYDITTW